MTTGRLGLAVLAAIALIYLLGFLNQVYLFLLLLSLTAGLVALTLYFLISDVIWLLTPSSIKAVYPRVHFSRVMVPFLVGGILLLSGAGNRYFFSDGLSVQGAAGFFMSLAFYVFLATGLLLKKSTKTLLKMTAVFVILLLAHAIWREWSLQTEANSSTVEELRALPYVAWGSAKDTIEKSGVVYYNADKSFAGLNLYNSRDLTKAYLVDMSGRQVHEWGVAPESDRDAWQHVELDPSGDLIAVVNDSSILRMDWNSKVKWKLKDRFHHDFDIAPNGDLYAITREDQVVFLFGLPVPCLNDSVVALSPDGSLKSRFSLLKVLRDHVPFGAVVNAYSWLLSQNRLKNIILRKQVAHSPYLFPQEAGIELFHANAVEYMEKDVPGFCKKGDLLISAPVLNLVGVIEMNTRSLGWHWGERDLKHQHNPTLLESGSVLIFDNGMERKYSRIVEVDPATRAIAWEYRGTPPESFYTLSRGGCQRLPNGNTLITESDSGRVFEVTGGGEMVWEFFNPDLDKKEKKRGAIFRMARIIDPGNYEFVRGFSEKRIDEGR